MGREFHEADVEEDIVAAVQKFFFEDDDFAGYFEDWCEEHASRIDLTTDENRLEYTSLHKDYLREFEDKITEFLDSRGSSAEEFFAALERAEIDSEADVFAQILNATVDFEVFMQMMREAALNLRG